MCWLFLINHVIIHVFFIVLLSVVNLQKEVTTSKTVYHENAQLKKQIEELDTQKTNLTKEIRKEFFIY